MPDFNGPSASGQEALVTDPIALGPRLRPMPAFAVDRGTRGDSCAGGDEQNASTRRDMPGHSVQCRHQRGGVHSLVVCDGDPIDGYPEAGGECGAVPVAGRSCDDGVDIGQFQC